MEEEAIGTTALAGVTFTIQGVDRRPCDVEGCEGIGSVEVLAKWDEEPESSRVLCRDHLALLEAWMARKDREESSPW